MELFVLDKIIISAITSLVHSPAAQLFTLLGVWAGTTVLLPKNKDNEKNQ